MYFFLTIIIYFLTIFFIFTSTFFLSRSNPRNFFLMFTYVTFFFFFFLFLGFVNFYFIFIGYMPYAAEKARERNRHSIAVGSKGGRGEGRVPLDVSREVAKVHAVRGADVGEVLH